MSKINRKTSLSLAIVAACMLAAPIAFAYTITGAPAIPVKIANVSVNTTTGNVSFPAESIVYSIDPSDNIIGRTTGISVRLTLQNGAAFLTAPTPTTTQPNWSAAVTAGGTPGDTFVVVSISPLAGSTGLTNGQLVAIGLTDISATTLTTVGNSVSGKFDIFDPVGGSTFDTQTLPLISSANVLASTVTGGEVNSRIDVGSNVTYANSKTAFSSTGAIGMANKVTFDAGTLTHAVASGVTYSFVAGDAFTTVVTMGNLGIFDGTAGNGSISLATNNSCTTPIAGATVVYSATGNTATFTYPASSLNGFAATGGSAEVCFTVPGTTKVVLDSTVSTSSSFKQFTTNTKSNDSAATALPLKYNGSVVNVPMYNPGGNTVQQSVLRVTNTSSLGGKVTVTGTDDSGAAGMPVTFQLGAGASTQISADTLQNGGTGLTGSMGTGHGKWRLVVTGEFNGLVVQSLMRNNNSGTFSNMSTGLTPSGLAH